MKVVLIGTGNLAFHLGPALKSSGNNLVQVYGRDLSKAKHLAQRSGCSFTNKFAEINTEADVVIIAVSDDAIREVANGLLFLPEGKIVVHTSGGTASEVLSGLFNNYGVFYPLQTFSANREIDFKSVPVCITYSSQQSNIALTRLAKSLSKKVYHITDKERAILHLAAVFANNFTNHMFTISEDICASEGLDFDILKPLINETVSKIEENQPRQMQTGPARRGDLKTIESHLKLLSSRPHLRKLYKRISKSIAKYFR